MKGVPRRSVGSDEYFNILSGSESSDLLSSESSHLTLKMTSVQDVETPVTANWASQDSFHLRYKTPGFKPFSSKKVINQLSWKCLK